MKKCVTSSVLFISLTICLIITSLITFIFLITVYNNSILLSNFSKKRLYANCLAGIDYVLHQYQSLDVNRPYSIDLYNTQEDSVQFVIAPWGIYDMVRVSAFHNGMSVTKTCLIGNKIAALHERVALYIADKGSPVLVSGDYNIKGKVFLPQSGVKYTSFTSENYTDVWAKISKESSDKELPELNQKILVPLMAKVQNISAFPYEYNAVRLPYIESDSVVNNSFDSLVYIVNTKASIITARKYKNLTLVSTVPVTLDAAAVFENVIVFAPAVTMHAGFKSTALQVYCTDSILVEDAVTLSYPSVLGIVKKTDTFIPKIRVGQHVNIAGCIFSIQKQFEKFNSIIYLNESSVVIGEVYAQGILEYKGKIAGSVYTNECNYFSVKSGYSKNTLISPDINVMELPEMYAVHNLVVTKSRKEIARWL